MKNLFKKTLEQLQPNLEQSQSNTDKRLTTGYVCTVTFWTEHHEAINKLIDELQKNEILKTDGSGMYIPCKLLPDPTNKYDKDAIAVYARIPNKPRATWHHIGFIPSKLIDTVKEKMKYVESGDYYFRINMKCSLITGTTFDVSIYESKFKK